MKTICYISNFASHLTDTMVDHLLEQVNTKNSRENITGILIIKNEHFFQVMEGESKKIDALYHKIKLDERHTGLIKLLDTNIESRIFEDYNSGEFEIFKNYSDYKKLLLYFKWIENANYLPAENLIQLTKNFLKQNT